MLIPPEHLVDTADLAKFQSLAEEHYRYRRVEWRVREAVGFGIVAILLSLWSTGRLVLGVIWAVSGSGRGPGWPNLLSLIFYIVAMFAARKAWRLIAAEPSLALENKASWRKRLLVVVILATIAITPIIIWDILVGVVLLVRFLLLQN